MLSLWFAPKACCATSGCLRLALPDTQAKAAQVQGDVFVPGIGRFYFAQHTALRRAVRAAEDGHGATLSAGSIHLPSHRAAGAGDADDFLVRGTIRAGAQLACAWLFSIIACPSASKSPRYKADLDFSAVRRRGASLAQSGPAPSSSRMTF